TPPAVPRSAPLSIALQSPGCSIRATSSQPPSSAPHATSTSAASSSGRTVRRSSTTRPSVIRPTTGGSPARNRASSASAESPGASSAIRHVGNGWSGYAPPPTAEAPLTSSTRYPPARSEEHTSELQSRENLVCRLLLEKKKTK